MSNHVTDCPTVGEVYCHSSIDPGSAPCLQLSMRPEQVVVPDPDSRVRATTGLYRGDDKPLP